MTYGYSMDALIYDAGTNTWSLRPDYDFTQHRVEFNITDDDGYLDGDYNIDEIGDDANQTGTVNDMDGNLIASGQIYDELFYEIQSPSGVFSYLEVIEIGGVAVGFIPSIALETGVNYAETGSGDVHTYDDDTYEGDTRLQYSDLESVPCFCQGTTLMTDKGDQPVDWIRPGDQVMTKDHGFQPVLWVGRTNISASKLELAPNLRPIRIAAHSIDPHTPTHDLLLSPEHRVLLKSPQIKLLFDCDEVFAAIKTVSNGGAIAQIQPRHDIAYYHILFQNHEIVLAQGLWVESFFPGNMGLSSLSAKNRAQIQQLLGPNAAKIKTARLCLKPWEVNLLVPQNNIQTSHCLLVA